jgi:hypothetical protein
MGQALLGAQAAIPDRDWKSAGDPFERHKNRMASFASRPRARASSLEDREFLPSGTQAGGAMVVFFLLN